MTLTKSGLALCLVPGLLAACSTAHAPREQLGAAETAVRQAQASQAPQYAPAELRMAADKLEAARRAMREEKYHEARRLAEQATVDAQLAEAKARDAQSQQTAREMRANIETLRREAERNSITR